jgi:hypothetical protein
VSTGTSEFRATNLDCVIALLVAIGLPLACGALYPFTGALVPLILYYGVCCVGIVKWRRGTLEYRRPTTWALPVFLTMLALQVAQQALGLLFLPPHAYPDLGGVLLTLFLWAPLNAVMEQLIWIYCFDAFATRFPEGRKRLASSIFGVILMLMLVGLIHAFFWVQFTPAVVPAAPFGAVFLALQFVITPLYILLYRRTHSMVPLALIHVISDVALVLGPGFSILPFLLP